MAAREPDKDRKDYPATQGALVYPVALINILTDLALALGPLGVIMRLRMPIAKRWAIASLLGFRIV